MECTQRLECTQELYGLPSERICPEQIGFLGICGTKYPVKRGPNKIGRDPQACNIVLNLNSISRQHAVINILNSTEFMLMDLDSANKTRLGNKVLQAYIPHPLINGDTVQFGDVFGIFRLLEEDNDLPMTQAIDIPDTPLINRHASRFNNIAVTTIPESPDVSDRDDSFIIPSQPKGTQQFKSPSNKYIKSSAKVIAIQPIGSNKIDNAYWNSSKKSTSLNLDVSQNGLNDSSISNKSNDTLTNENNLQDIHEMETQAQNQSIDSIYTAETQIPTIVHNESTNSIYTADTQLPTSAHNDSTDSIYMAQTQMPAECHVTPSIHCMDTQLPTSTEHLPEVCKIDKQKEMHIDLYSANKENDNNIFNAETKLFDKDSNVLANSINKNIEKDLFEANTQLPTCKEHYNVINDKNVNVDNSKLNAETQYPASGKITSEEKKPSKAISKLNVSDEEILFDDVYSQSFLDDFDSQPLLPTEISLDDVSKNIPNELTESENSKRTGPVVTDCEDFNILPTQKVNEINTSDNDFTDCEDNDLIEISQNKSDIPATITSKGLKDIDNELTDCEDGDMDIEKTDKPSDGYGSSKLSIDNKSKPSNDSPDVSFEDMPTQIIELSIDNKSKLSNDSLDVSFEDMPTQIIDEIVGDCKSSNEENNLFADKSVKETDFEEMPTQILEDHCDNDVDFENQPTQVLKEKVSDTLISTEDHNQQYSEEMISPFKIPFQTPLKIKRKDIPKSGNPTFIKANPPHKTPPFNERDEDNYYAATQEILEDLCSQREPSPEVKPIVKPRANKVSPDCRFRHLDSDLLPKQKFILADESPEVNVDEKINSFVANLSSKQIRDVIGVDLLVEKVKRVPSDPSDVEVTPKKVRPFKLMATDLPNSQEIKISVSLNSKSLVTESSSESEVENESQELDTPILFKQMKRPKSNAIIDLTKKFDSKVLPSRIITRIRKPSSKLQDSDEKTKKRSKSFLKPIFLADQEDDIDKDILTENISRLRNKNEKKNNKSNTGNSPKSDEIKKQIKAGHTANNLEIKKTSEVKTALEKERVKHKIKDINELDENKHKPKSNPKHEGSKNNLKNKDDMLLKTNETNVSVSNNTLSNNESLNSTVDTNRSTRSTRHSKNKQNNSSKSSEMNSLSPEKDAKRKRGRPRKHKEESKNDSSPEKEVEIRRSKRQRTVKDKKEPKGKEKQVSTSTSQPVHEQSTVYSVSSESSIDSPKGLKRSAVEHIEVPKPKRTRSALTSNGSSLRSTPARMNRTQYVLFTAFPCEKVKVELEKLGAIIVTDVTKCSLVLTMQIKRTFKLLCAVGLGRPIVGPQWVQACVDTNTIVDPWLYLIKDEVTEKRFHFTLDQTLSGKRNFLRGYHVSSTPSVMPSTPEMKLIVESSGGTWKAQKPQWICVSCSADKALWSSLKQLGAIVVSSEFILSGVLRQKLDIEANRLC